MARFKKLLILLAAAITGSGIPVFSKIVLQTLNPEEMMTIRLFVAWLVFLPWVWKSLPKKFSDWLAISLVTLPAVINMVLFANGVQFTSATMAQLIYAFSPIVAAVIVVIIGQEKLTRGKISGIAIGFFGMMILLVPSINLQTANTLIGNLKGNGLLLIGMICWTIYTIASKPLNNRFAAQIISFNLLVNGFLANFILGGFRIFSPEKLGQIPLSTWGWIVYLSVVCSIGFFSLYQLSIKLTSAVTTSIMHYLTPVFTFIWAAGLLRESLNWFIVLGGGLTIAGAYLTTTAKKA
ncbi:hypothetical protein COX59_01065 [Candidatus Beckwithbacteria bacterium CG_4_10_14_0_2_um_filter_47_25]|uniref:EamA domain-containing protein n=1 Tax=Candidatus Beckwithbacteria bacterium CG_4_10_14_0_2_um_filter_47_25 TaxID=1974493 RepID=A0A2M7W768_9BACT|nr:MAG: hypothetical protein COX59_01065 [Candidatus Beckwithbacteria bacterium CG_4_10_14_0_2_um_filter_47_25]